MQQIVTVTQTLSCIWCKKIEFSLKMIELYFFLQTDLCVCECVCVCMYVCVCRGCVCAGGGTLFCVHRDQKRDWISWSWSYSYVGDAWLVRGAGIWTLVLMTVQHDLYFQLHDVYFLTLKETMICLGFLLLVYFDYVHVCVSQGRGCVHLRAGVFRS